MKRMKLLAATAILALAPLTAGATMTQNNVKPVHGTCKQCAKPRIDVVFLLDTTGSMHDLIEGAKIKIWSIANEMMQAERPPELRIGLIGYRDRGDAYVTRSYSLTDDIDSIYGQLLKFHAKGGGDRPESVNQALYNAVDRMNWSRDPKTYRVVFLVGDSPPKMNYQDDVKYQVTARKARHRDIIINTVLAGNAADTMRIWQHIASLAGGRFAVIPQSGNMQSIDTPYDQDIRKLQYRLNGSALPYGSRHMKDEVRRKLERDARAPNAVTADRQAYIAAKGAKSEVVTGRGELINDLEEKRVKLKDLKPAELPKEMQAMTGAEREAYVKQKTVERESIRDDLDKLVAKRRSYIVAERKKTTTAKADSFDDAVGRMIREQGRIKGITY